MEAIQNRTDSFSKLRRVKQSSSSKSKISLKWPHASHFRANPDTLAEAGFFFNPSYEDRDNVTCYMCGKELSDWAEDDDPFDIHWMKCGNECGWASVRCGLRTDTDRNGRYVFLDKMRIPSSKVMENARLETFMVGDGWPHDQTKNHGATSKKMAHAGFVYTPQEPGDDLATCLYCNISLSGWDVDDDPMEEHRKRENKSGFPCPFFNNLPPSKPVSKVQTTKPASKSTSKSKPHTKHTDILEPTKIYDGEDSDSTVTITAGKTAGAKTPRKARATSTVKTPRTLRSRSRSRSKSKADTAETEEDDEAMPPPISRKASKFKSKTDVLKADLRVEKEDEEEEKVSPPLPASRRQPSRSAASVSRKVSKAKLKATESEEEEGAPLVAPVSKKPASKVKAPASRKSSKSKSKFVEEQNFEEGEEEDIPITPSVSKKPISKLRSKSRVVDEDEGELLPASAELRKSSKSDSKAKSKANIITEDNEDADVPLPPPKPASKSTVVPAPAKTQSKSKEKGKSNVRDVGNIQSEDGPGVHAKTGTGMGKEVEVLEISTDDEDKEEDGRKVDKKVPMITKDGGNELAQIDMKFRGNGGGGPTNTDPEIELEPPSKLKPRPIKQKKSVFVEIVKPLRLPQLQPPPLPPPPQVEEDAEMAQVEKEISMREKSASPVTPRAAAEKPFQQTKPIANSSVELSNNNTPTFQFAPPLSKLPFLNLESLSQAEMDMTVEEWIRYQMGIEYEKFKMDGERELASFKGRAEEVRRAIEVL